MSLKENLKLETVARLNLREAITVATDKTVRDAIEAMRRGHLGCAIVVDEQHEPVGIFTEAILRHEISIDPSCIDAAISDHVATVFPWVTTTDPIETVLDAMETKNHRFVVVVDEAGKVVGLTGQKGLMEYVAEHFPAEVMVQRIGTEPYPRSREGA